MLWQDWVISVGQFLFFLALIPSITSRAKPTFETSVMTALVLTVFIPVMLSLELYLGAFTSALIAAGWWVLACQRWQEVFLKQNIPGMTEKIDRGREFAIDYFCDHASSLSADEKQRLAKDLAAGRCSRFDPRRWPISYGRETGWLHLLRHTDSKRFLYLWIRGKISAYSLTNEWKQKEHELVMALADLTYLLRHGPREGFGL